MSTMLDVYCEVLRSLIELQTSLVSALQKVIHLKPVNTEVHKLEVRGTSISEGIRNWPADAILLPLPLWVEPDQGIVDIDSGRWKFFFHGQGVTFTHTKTDQVVQVDFSVEGHTDAVSKWTVKLFIKTSVFDAPHLQGLLESHEALFDEMVKSGYLVELPRRDAFDERLFVLHIPKD